MYSAESILLFERDKADWIRRSCAVRLRYLQLIWQNADAEKFVKYGLVRRIYQMDHYLNRVFELLPLEDSIPSKNNIFDATAFIQAFTIHVYGALDNIAQIWDLEKAQSGLPQKQIGLFARYKNFGKFLPQDIQEKLAKHREWQKYIEKFRDALVHRIPHYLPPKTLTPKEQEHYHAVDAELNQQRSSDSIDNYYQTLSTIGRFQPYMVGSPHDEPMPALIHPQMICDFAAIIELCEMFFLHLED